MKYFLILFCLLEQGLVAQTLSQCRQRFNNYLNFRGALNAQVRFEGDAIYLLNAGGKKEMAVYKEELAALSVFFENSTVREQEIIMQRKGLKRYSQKQRDSLLLSTVNKKRTGTGNAALPLQGARIAIDPGHFGTTLAEAQVEQKFLCFAKDPVKFPKDSVKLFESSLTFNTAKILQHMLEEQGATTFLTRQQSNYTSFNCSYNDWLRLHKKRTLDSLKQAGALSNEKHQRLSGCSNYKFFWDFFRDYDLANRANKVNQFNPHATIIIHYNVDEKNVPWKSHTKKNYSMTFIGGGFTARDLGKGENRMHFLRLLLTGQLERSEELASETVNKFNQHLGIPIACSADATYLKNNCIATASRGVFCRNLVLCRKINSPLVYGESLYQDNINETELLMKSDVDLYGIKTNARLVSVAKSYYEAVVVYLKNN